ncbi:MAG: hypothetical protein EOM62_01995 [Bacteroidia bacterium]|nr:hypothetical protein [Bacteroidia bacterium]
MSTNKLFSVKQIAFGVVGLIVAAIFFIMTPFEGLPAEGMKALGLFLMAVIWWMGGVFPDFVTAFWLMATMLSFGIVPLGTAFSAFSGGVIWIVIPALAIGAALSKSGLLARIVLKILSMFKADFKSQTLAFLVAGNVIGPLIPSATAKVAIAAPLCRVFSDTMGYEAKTKPAAGMFSAMWVSFGTAGPFFLTGTTMCFTMIGFLPEGYQSGWTFMRWLAAAWPWGLALFVLSYIAIRLFYTPKQDVSVSSDFIQEKRAALGKMSRDEKIAATTLILCLLLWVSESWHGISAAVVALIGMSILLSTGVLDRKSFRSNIPWDAVIFIGVSTGLGGVFKATGINDWVSATFAPYLEPLFSNVFILMVASVIIISVLRYAFVSQTTLMMVFTVASAPFAIAAGINPFIPGFAALVTVNVWNVIYHNMTFLTALAASGDMAEFKDLQKMSYVYMLACIVGLLCCVPMWNILGLM